MAKGAWLSQEGQRISNYGKEFTVSNGEKLEVDFEGLVHQTPDAWLILTADDEQVWLPKSQCELDEDGKVVKVPEWLAIKKGLV